MPGCEYIVQTIYAKSQAQALAVALGGKPPFLKPRKVGILLGAISAESHTAPSSSVSPCLIEEEEDAVLSRACLDVPKICRANECGNFFRDGCEQRFRLAPSASRPKTKTRGGYIASRPL